MASPQPLFRPVILRLLAALLLAACVLPASVRAEDNRTKIVFLAGPKDHGWPGRHEYEKDLRVLAASLEQSANLKNITTVVHVGRVPPDLALFQDAAAIVINSSSDRLETETHPLFPGNPTTNGRGYDEATTAFLKSLDALIREKQIGVVFRAR